MTYLFTECVTESCDSPDRLIQYCLSSASSRVTETVSMKMPCGECFEKCFSEYNMISLWLNTVIYGRIFPPKFHVSNLDFVFLGLQFNFVKYVIVACGLLNDNSLDQRMLLKN